MGLELERFWEALAKSAAKRGRRRGWLAVLWDALVAWLRPKVRGAAGEHVLALRLRAELAGTGAAVKGPFMVYRSDGQGTAEVDGLVIAPTGIFVIEAKTYKGEISGGADDAEWTQILGRTKRKFQNPLRQNYGHWKDVANIVGPRLRGAVVPLVAFSGEAKFRGTRPAGVVDCREVAAYVKGRKPKRRLTPEDIAAAKKAVEEAVASVTKEDRKRHVERLKERHGRK